jgi:uncharacterized protein YaaQ
MSLYADDIKTILYILPVLSGLICAVYVRLLNKASEAAASGQSDWRATNLSSKGGGGATTAIQLIGQQDDELDNVKNIGLVIEYNDAALEAHAKKGKISQFAWSKHKHVGHALENDARSCRSCVPSCLLVRLLLCAQPAMPVRSRRVSVMY